MERIDADSSCNASSLNTRLGWSGLGAIFSSSTSLIEEEPCVSASLKVISASNPLPNAFFFAIIYIDKKYKVRNFSRQALGQAACNSLHPSKLHRTSTRA